MMTVVHRQRRDAVALFHSELDHLGGEAARVVRSEEHTSELQSLMRISYAIFCLIIKTIKKLTSFKRAHIEDREIHITFNTRFFIDIHLICLLYYIKALH